METAGLAASWASEEFVQRGGGFPDGSSLLLLLSQALGCQLCRCLVLLPYKNETWCIPLPAPRGPISCPRAGAGAPGGQNRAGRPAPQSLALALRPLVCLLQVLKKAFQATFRWLLSSSRTPDCWDLDPHALLFLRGNLGPSQ